MDCRDFENLLADYVAGQLAPDIRLRAESHVTECVACRCLLEIAHGKLDLMPEQGKKDLTRLILTHTSGGACRRARDLLCDFVDGALQGDDAELVSLHVENCAGCRNLAGVLLELNQILPRMAEMQPGEDFTEEVMRATLGLRPAPRPRLRTRIQEWWKRAVQRPRFSLEAAYVGTLVVAIFLGNPFPAMQALSVRALDAASKAAAANINKHEPAAFRFVKEFAVDLSNREQGVRQSMELTRQRGENTIAAAVDYQIRTARAYWGRGTQALRNLWLQFRSGTWKHPSTNKPA